jgi:hypothetical protein
VKRDWHRSKEFVFIIGAPRSGTTWLQTMLGAHPQVATAVELTLYNKYAAAWIRTWQQEARYMERGDRHQGLPFLWAEEDLYGFLQEFVLRVYGRLLARNPQATHVLDKHPGYSWHVHDIHRLLPKARFIHMIRDGRDVAVSMVAARKRAGFGRRSIQASSIAWKEMVLAARRAKRFEGRYLEVRYEDLLDRGLDTLNSVFSFCELPVRSEFLRSILREHQFDRMKAKRQSPVRGLKTSRGHYRTGQAGSWRKDLGPVKRCIFDREAGHLLCELGYAREGWWVTSPLQGTTQSMLASALLAGRAFRSRLSAATAALIGPALTTRLQIAKRRLRRQ